MEFHPLSFLSSLATLIFFIFSGIPCCLSNPELYRSCSYQPSCGNITIKYPFWGQDRVFDCGIPELQVTCDKDVATIKLNDVSYRVLAIDYNSQVLKIARQDFLDGVCAPKFVNTSLDPAVFENLNDYTNITFRYGCVPGVFPALSFFICAVSGSAQTTGYIMEGAVGPGTCYRSVYFPISLSAVAEAIRNWMTAEQVSSEGFEARWKVDNRACSECVRSQGACGYNPETGKTICYCSNGSGTCSSSLSPETAPVGPGRSSKASLGIGLGVAGAAVFGIGLGAWIILVVQRRKRKAALPILGNGKDEPTPQISSKVSKSITKSSAIFSQTTSSFQSSKSTNTEKGSTYFGVQVFSYSELEHATENFDSSKELGDGGFGAVYYGVLQDGRAVAVKRLYENNLRRAEQFMNEIEILACLRHPNLVTLYGCTSRRSRELLLVYEYVPNGTVADHLNGKQSETGVLTWPIRLRIAIETAEALSFLHAKEVIHRDVKTNNILLDSNFCVKVADFGLSKFFPTDVTHVSTAPQGTPGYVDPEYYQCYQLTYKSDVYSFGVVLIELISSLTAVDTNRHRQDINLANMAISKIQNHALRELVDPSLGFESDYAVRRMVTSVAELAFRCLQQERDMRPTMEEVLEGLKRTENENYGAEKVEIVDVGDDDVGLLKHLPPPLSPDSATSAPIDKWDKMVKTF